MTHATRVCTVMIAVAIVMAVTDHTAAQQGVIVEADLLTEVRKLRTALEKVGGANARVQIVFGRLQMQEQRTQSAAAKLERARQALKSFNTMEVHTANEIKRLEEQTQNPKLTAEQRQNTQDHLDMIHRRLEFQDTERARLTAEEADAAHELAQEQARWSALDRQLDELERQLTIPPQ